MSRVKITQNIGRLVAFQLKLLADAFRDFVMSPLSIVCFILDVILVSEEGNSFYERLMRFGQKSDRWINLFEEHGEQEIVESRPPLE